MYEYMLRAFEHSPAAWNHVIPFYRRYRSSEELLQVLQRATDACPEEDDFWIQRAKELFNTGEASEAAKVIEAAMAVKETETAIVEAVWSTR